MPQTINNLPAMARVRSLGQEYPQQKGKATHTSILAWRIAWTEEPSGLQSMGPQRVGHSVLFFFPFVFCMTNNVTFEFRTKVLSSHFPDDARFLLTRNLDPDC